VSAPPLTAHQQGAELTSEIHSNDFVINFCAQQGALLSSTISEEAQFFKKQLFNFQIRLGRVGGWLLQKL
jgi:hypothetical protein